MSEQGTVQYELIGDVVRIFQRGQKWYANYQSAGKQFRVSLKTTNKKEARRKAIQLESDILQGRDLRRTKSVTPREVTSLYLDTLSAEQRAPKTRTKYTATLDRAIELSESKHIRKLEFWNLQFIDSYRQRRVKAGMSAKTIYGELVIIRQLVNFALSRKLIFDDPLAGLRLRKPKPTPQPCWTPAEVERILIASGAIERLKFTVLADTGMRVGELRHLSWDDVDFQRNLLHIRPKGNWQPKSGDQRSIPMTPRVCELLQNLSRRGRWVFTAARSKKYPNGDHQFSDRHLLTSLKRVLKGLGLRGHIHTFRHAFISAALTSGTPEAIVRQWVGHVDAEIMKLYTHIADMSSQAAMQHLAETNNDCSHTEGAGDGAKNHEPDSAHSQHTDDGTGGNQNAA